MTTRHEIREAARRQVLDHVARRLEESDSRLIDAVEAGQISLSRATTLMEIIHEDACTSLEDIIRDAVSRVEARLS
jgi:hypothetical protein